MTNLNFFLGMTLEKGYWLIHYGNQDGETVMPFKNLEYATRWAKKWTTGWKEKDFKIINE